MAGGNLRGTKREILPPEGREAKCMDRECTGMAEEE